jgi:hypothetical protein
MAGCATKRKGDACEAHVLAALVAAGLTVLVPWGDNCAFDLVVQVGKCFLRIQCKAGRLTGNGCVAFNAYRVGRAPVRARYSPDEFDYYGVWCSATGGRQASKVRWADKYSIGLVIESWLRTGGDFESAWTAPALVATGQWRPGRHRASLPSE